MRNAVLINNEARATGNYSYQSTRMRGDRYIMVGDAYAFIDPVFSSGVLLGMNSGVLGADAVDAWLRNDPATEERFLHFERMVRRGVKTFSWFIWRFNSPGMRSLMLHPGNPLRVQEAVTSLARRRRLPRHRRPVALLAVQVLLLHVQPEARPHIAAPLVAARHQSPHRVLRRDDAGRHRLDARATPRPP